MQAVVHCDPGHRTHDFVYPTEEVISTTETKIFIGWKGQICSLTNRFWTHNLRTDQCTPIKMTNVENDISFKVSATVFKTQTFNMRETSFFVFCIQSVMMHSKLESVKLKAVYIFCCFCQAEWHRCILTVCVFCNILTKLRDFKNLPFILLYNPMEGLLCIRKSCYGCILQQMLSRLSKGRYSNEDNRDLQIIAPGRRPAAQCNECNDHRRLQTVAIGQITNVHRPRLHAQPSPCKAFHPRADHLPLSLRAALRCA